MYQNLKRTCIAIVFPIVFAPLSLHLSPLKFQNVSYTTVADTNYTMQRWPGKCYERNNRH